MKMRGVLISVLVCCISFALNPGVQAQQKYPNKPITFVVPFGPGGASDLCWRTLIEDLKANLGVPINVVNKSGAGGLAGTDVVAYSKPDGYTLLASNNTCMTVSPAIDPKTYRDLVPLAVVARQAILVATRSDHEIKTFEEMIRRAKEKPGALTVGTTGVSSSTYFDLALLESASGTSFSHVPVPQSSEGMAMLLGGHIDFWFGTLSITQNLMKAGRVRGIATCVPERLSAYPDIPTFAEKGYPSVNLNLTMIIYGPKGTPPEVIKAWEDALSVTMKKPQTTAALEKVDFEVDFQIGSEKILKFLAQQREELAGIAKAKGIKP